MTTTAEDRTTVSRDDNLRAVVAATRQAVRSDPAQATALFTGTGRARDAVTTELSFRGHDVVVDEPSSLGGEDAAPNPVEFALAALISCQVVTYRFWAAELGVAVDDVQIRAEGDVDVRGFFGLQDGVRPGFGDVRLEVRLTGPESPERYAELHRVVDEHCPVLDLFSNPTPVHTTLTVD